MFINYSRTMLVAFAVFLLSAVGCAPKSTYDTRDIQYTPSGTVQQSTVETGGQVINELQRQIQNTVFEGIGTFTNANEGLARRAATQLAVAELAGKVATAIKGNTRIYNNQDIRDIVETNIQATVKNYDIVSGTYDVESQTYTIEISVTGEKVVQEFERRLRL